MHVIGAALAILVLAGPPVVAQTSTSGAGEALTGAAIAETFAGARLDGVNAEGTPYSVLLSGQGALDGIAGANGEYKDTGRWWVEGDQFCRQWQVWLEGAADCFVAVREGDLIHWHRADGTFVATETYSR